MFVRSIHLLRSKELRCQVFIKVCLLTLETLCCKYINKANFIRNMNNKNMIGCFAMFHTIRLGGKKYMGV